MTRKGRERSGEESVRPYYLRTPFTEKGTCMPNFDSYERVFPIIEDFF